jgi:hypothetical protein
MRFSTALAAAASASLASARIAGVDIPSEVEPGVPFELILIGENYIQTVADIGIAYGIQKGKGYPGSLGTVVGSTYLGPCKTALHQ